ncbi:MAG: plasmid recombination protein [Oscillospiraceae bacterium]|nr:plasmid recombination protein [Oscillospiraceae bacterium]
MSIATKIDRTVVRNQAYRAGEFNVRERHNERKNESYHNGEIDLSRADLNVHFRRVLAPDGLPETYEQTFKRLLDEGVIVKRGLKPDAKVFDELVFDVNTAYFENHGGYEYARSFFEEAYRLAVNEIGGEEYILSAVMHADERNRALSDDLGRDVYHYHLHVVYVPVVEKEIYFRKNHKDPALAGTLKEVIPQISHSKKWPMRVSVEKDGKTVMLNAYSLLQDRFFEHMRAAGFEDFERGERGSTAEHLTDLEFKIKKDRERVAVLDEVIEKKGEQLVQLEQKTVLERKRSDAFAEIDDMADRRTMMGDVIVSQEDWQTVSNLAKEGQKSRGIIKTLKDTIVGLKNRILKLERRLELYETKKLGISDSMKFYKALQRAPRRMMEAIAEIMRNPPERIRQEPMRQKTREMER